MMAAAKKKAKAESDQAKDDVALKLLEARQLGLRDGKIEGLGTAIRLLLEAGDPAAQIIYAELVRRYPHAPPISKNVDHDLITMLARGTT